MTFHFILPLAFTLVDIGRIISLAVIGGGLLWFFIRALKRKEVERRIIFIFIFVAVAAPILFPTIFQEKATPIVKSVFDKIESMPPGSTVLLSYDFDPAMAPEVQPMADAFTRHCLVKGHKIIFMCLFATGQGQFTSTLENVIKPEFPEKVNLVDYVNIGYKAGNEGVLNVIITDFKKMFPTDVDGVPYENIPVFSGIRSCKDLDLVLAIGGGKPGIKEWILFIGDPGNVPIASGVAAVMAPLMYPYYPAQMLGLLGGIKGAAEYESELIHHYPRFQNSPTPALLMMSPQTLAHIVIMAFIIIGNTLYFMERKKGGQR